MSVVVVRLRELALRWSITSKATVAIILSPPSMELDGAAVFWSNIVGLSNMVGLLRPCWSRLISGQPHLAFAYVFSHNDVEVRDGHRGRCRRGWGGCLRLAGHEALPVRIEFTADPIRSFGGSRSPSAGDAVGSLSGL